MGWSSIHLPWSIHAQRVLRVMVAQTLRVTLFSKRACIGRLREGLVKTLDSKPDTPTYHPSRPEMLTSRATRPDGEAGRECGNREDCHPKNQWLGDSDRPPGGSNVTPPGGHPVQGILLTASLESVTIGTSGLSASVAAFEGLPEKGRTLCISCLHRMGTKAYGSRSPFPGGLSETRISNRRYAYVCP